MTPSEIAEVYGMGDLPTNELLLEVISKQAEALKIATEALEGIGALPDKVPVTDGVGVSQAMRYGLEVSAKQATQALARIKEVGA